MRVNKGQDKYVRQHEVLAKNLSAGMSISLPLYDDSYELDEKYEVKGITFDDSGFVWPALEPFKSCVLSSDELVYVH